MAHLGPLAPRVAESLRRFVLLDAGPYRLEEEGQDVNLCLPLGLETDGGEQKD